MMNIEEIERIDNDDNLHQEDLIIEVEPIEEDGIIRGVNIIQDDDLDFDINFINVGIMINIILSHNCSESYIRCILNYIRNNRISINEVIAFSEEYNMASDLLDEDNKCYIYYISEDEIALINRYLMNMGIMHDFEYIAELINYTRLITYCPFKLMKIENEWRLYTNRNNIITINDVHYMNVLIGQSTIIDVLHLFVDYMILLYL